MYQKEVFRGYANNSPVENILISGSSGLGKSGAKIWQEELTSLTTVSDQLYCSNTAKDGRHMISIRNIRHKAVFDDIDAII